MSRWALIVEDEEGVAALLGELCSELGLAPVRARGGGEAAQRLSEGMPAIVLLDLVLADSDGFSVASHLRSLPGGATVPVIAMSGIYKKCPPDLEALGVSHFLVKPFELSVLGDLVRRLVPSPDRAIVLQRGDFEREHPEQLFARLCEERAGGMLEAVSGETRRRLWWQLGQIRHAQSNVRAESIGAMQVAEGRLDAASFEAALAHARGRRIALHDALAAVGAMGPQAVAEALRAQTREVAAGVLGLAAGRWTLFEADPEKMPDARLHPLVFMAQRAPARRTPEEARKALARLADGRVTRTPLLERELFALRAAVPGETVTALAAQRPMLSALTSKLRAEDAPFAWTLVAAGLLAVEREGEDRSAPRPGAGVPAEDAGLRFKPEEADARRFIFDELARTATLDHYALLGVAPGAGADEIQRAYHERAKAYHADAYSGLELGSARTGLGTLFQRVNEANQTLSDPKKRADYDILVERRAQGLPTDIDAILRAENAFRRGQSALAAGRAAEALEAFREATELNAAEPEHHAWWGLALWRARGAAATDEARLRLEHALSKAPQLACAHHFLGVIARDTGHEDEALARFEKAARADPDYQPARRDLAVLLKRRQGSGRSLLRRLLGR